MITTTRGGGLAVLTYHAFASRRSVTAVTPDWFAETLDRLAEAGFHAVDLQDWVDRGRPDEPLGFALTFDDGLRSLLHVAEQLGARRLPATIFVVTDRVGRSNDWPGQPRHVPTERLLDWSELEALGGLGFRFGSHGTSHAHLDRLSPIRQSEELRRSRETIEARLQRPCRLLAYPYGANGPDLRRSAALHYTAALGTRLGYADARQDPFQLQRIDAFYLKTIRDLNALATNRWRSHLAFRDAFRTARGRATRWLGSDPGALVRRVR
ncbi:MAG: polysaccharide deacetylase family protein [Isosphaeraceae bacterium]